LKKLILGSRGSALALVQSRLIMALLRAAAPGMPIDLKIIKTTGDQLQSKDVSGLPPGKGLFTREIEEALLRNEIDLAVHSLKDLPTDLPPGLVLAAITERADARDALVTRGPRLLAELPKQARIATGSPRRAAQIKLHWPDFETVDVRGNVDTRLRKLREHRDWDGLILAQAGLQRLQPDLSGLIVTPLPFEEMLPAPGQGALAVQVRADDAPTRKIAASIDHAPSRAQVVAERAFLAGLGGGCLLPIAAYGAIDGENLKLDGICWLDGSTQPKRGSIRGACGQAEKLGRELAGQLLA
jgi:hydroxymethylbilane synthase